MANVKLVVTVPKSHADTVRQTLGLTGAGKVGNYSFASFSTKGVGRFKPMKGAKPTIGQVGKLESVNEERVEVVVDKAMLKKVVKELRKVHPYEEPAIDIYPLEDP